MKKHLLAMRSCVTLLTCLLLVTFTLSSCGEKAYIAVYPEEYTPLYFYENYVQCDPNLIHLRAARNSAGKLKRDSARYEYYAIKDVPMEEYICYSEDYVLFDPGFSSYLARNKAVEMPQPEVLTWTVTGAELYWRDGHHFSDTKGKMMAVGEKICYATVAETDGTAFQTHLKTVMEESTYLENGMGCNWDYVHTQFRNEEGVGSDLLLHLRLHFAEYENIVWDGMITTIAGQEGFFVHSYVWITPETFPEGYYSEIFVPLPAEIAELIPEI